MTIHAGQGLGPPLVRRAGGGARSAAQRGHSGRCQRPAAPDQRAIRCAIARLPPGHARVWNMLYFPIKPTIIEIEWLSCALSDDYNLCRICESESTMPKTLAPEVRSQFAKRLKAMRVHGGFERARYFAKALGIEENRYTRYER